LRRLLWIFGSQEGKSHGRQSNANAATPAGKFNNLGDTFTYHINRIFLPYNPERWKKYLDIFYLIRFYL